MSDAARQGPVTGSYWVVPGRLLAGRYPATEELDALQDAGVDAFFDLTIKGEEGLASYEESLGGGSYTRFGVIDFGRPSPRQMAEILDAFDAALDAGRTVYVHCRYGIGRTGTVAGCYLVRHGLSGEEALAAIGEWRGDGLLPETDAQRGLVLGWTGR